MVIMGALTQHPKEEEGKKKKNTLLHQRVKSRSLA